MGKLPIDYGKLVSRINNYYSGSEDSEGVFRVLLIATLVDKDYGLYTGVESKALSVFNNCRKADVWWARNLCTMAPDYPHLVLYVHIGAIWQAYLMHMLCRYYGVCFTTDLPKASELLDNWPITEADYYGTNAPRFCYEIDNNGRCVEDLPRANVDIGFVSGCLMLGMIDGSVDDTLDRWGMDIANYAKLYIDAWKARFTSSSAYHDDPVTYFENNYPFEFWSANATSLLLIVQTLWKIGLISDDDLGTYVAWINDVWRQYLLGLDGSDIDSREAGFFLAMELLYNNLAKSSSLQAPQNQTIDSLVSLVNSSAAVTVTPDLAVLYFANEQFGVLIKRPRHPATGDIITIDAWEATVELGGDGIVFSPTIISGETTVTVKALTKSWWRIKRIA